MRKPVFGGLQPGKNPASLKSSLLMIVFMLYEIYE